MSTLPRISLRSCLKGSHEDLDKAIPPTETYEKVSAILAKSGLNLVSDIRRIDSGRLGIPVYMSVCGADTRGIMPVRKQMGKGSSPEQAKASALMELIERFSFFTFWERAPHFRRLRWTEAKNIFGDELLPLQEMLASVNDELPFSLAEAVLDLQEWAFYPATRLSDGQIVWLPLDWFRMLGEFNGSSAGNTSEESLLQGLGELLERHVCCIAEKSKNPLPSIDASNSQDPKLKALLEAFCKNGIQLILKDMSLGLPMPTVAALAWDPATFPESSEIVFTAGTASSPAKAAIRAITEVAQLGGDFHSHACYEASGLSKYHSLEECAWILAGPTKALSDLPSIENNDLQLELQTCLQKLAPLNVYAVETSHPLLKIPAHYCIAPGLQFRERAQNQSLGLFTGRKLAEEKPFYEALAALEKLEKLLPNAPYLPFFRGLSHLNNSDPESALPYFKNSIPLQDDEEACAMTQFYAAYALTQCGNWHEAQTFLEAAIDNCAEIKEYHNLLGVTHFKNGKYAEAEEAFSQALKLDKGSAMDLANRGICRKLQGKNQAAVSDLMAALDLDPSLDFAARHLEELLKK